MNAKFVTLLLSSALLAASELAHAQTTAFTYQGRLAANGNPAGGNYDLRFTLYSAASGGSQVGNALTNSSVFVANGIFTTVLDFGSGIFNGANLWIEVGVRTNGSTSAFTALSPLQPLTPAPYAITASNLSGTLPAAQLSGALPSGVLSGAFASAVALNNANNSFVGGFAGNGGGLTNLAAASLIGMIPDAKLSTNVALLDLPNTATQATALPVIISGFITSANVTSGGFGYSTPPAVTISDTTGSNAVITATISNGIVVSLTVQNAGIQYSIGATLTIAPPLSNAYQIFRANNVFTGVNTMTNPSNSFAGYFMGNAAGLTNLSVPGAPVWQTVAGTNVQTDFF